MLARRLRRRRDVLSSRTEFTSIGRSHRHRATSSPQTAKRSSSVPARRVTPPFKRRRRHSGRSGRRRARLQARALPPERLKLFSPEAIYNALTNGKMQVQASALSEPERKAAAEFAERPDVQRRESGAREELLQEAATEHRRSPLVRSGRAGATAWRTRAISRRSRVGSPPPICRS